MKHLFISLVLLSFFSVTPNFSQQTNLNKKESFRKLDDNYSVSTNSPAQKFVTLPLKLEGIKSESDYVIGPEINTQLSGFYDYQTNGECRHYINRYNFEILHSVYMTATDSINLNRKTYYSFSEDDGLMWLFVTDVPWLRSSGFCALTTKVYGEAVITNHYMPTTELRGALHYDIAPGAGTFTTVIAPYNMIWPGCARLSNGNILVVGETYTNGTGTDTGSVAVFYSNTNTFGPLNRFYYNGISQTNMRWTYAAGPNSKAIYVIDALSDVGGNFGLNRMFYTTSTDNGISWAPLAVLYNPSVINGDTIVPFIGLDAIYDQSGSFYVAFNSTDPAGTFASAKLWIIKNGGTPYLVTQHSGRNGIPEAANSPLHADAGICTIDHPSLSISSSGTCLYVAYSVQYQNDTLNGFNKCHIYISNTPTSSMVFSPPVKVTNSGPGSFDERYTSINQVTPNLGPPNNSTVYLVYQKDPQPGSFVADYAPVSRATLIFRKIYDYNCSEIGIKNIGTEIPFEYKLYQNYPNPFNPETKIQFDIPFKSNITINVYDALGRFVTALAYNELVSPGRKEVSFNNSSLSSGVYFYTLEAKSDGQIAFIETKKMVALK